MRRRRNHRGFAEMVFSCAVLCRIYHNHDPHVFTPASRDRPSEASAQIIYLSTPGIGINVGGKPVRISVRPESIMRRRASKARASQCWPHRAARENVNSEMSLVIHLSIRLPPHVFIISSE